MLLWKYGRSDLVKQMSLDDELAAESKSRPAPADTPPEQLADDLEAMGPTFVKLGQVLSSRPDLLPDAYLKALARLQDKVKPFPYAEVEQIVEAELGVRISKAFSRFDPEPIAAASLGQVHAAALRDGREVVVKVQRPDVAQQVAEDFEVLAEIAGFLDEHTEFGRRHRFVAMLEELRIVDPARAQLRARSAEPGRDGQEPGGIRADPGAAAGRATTARKRVLTMDYVQRPEDHQDSARWRASSSTARRWPRSCSRPISSRCWSTACSTPIRIPATSSSPTTAASRCSTSAWSATPRRACRRTCSRCCSPISEGKGEELADADLPDQREERGLRRGRLPQAHRAARGRSRKDQALQADQRRAGTLLEVTRIAADIGLYVPSELTLLGKTLLQLDEVGKILDPEFDPNAAIRRNVADLMSRAAAEGHAARAASSRRCSR